MGRAKKAKMKKKYPAKKKGGAVHRNRDFSDTTRGQRLRRILKRSRNRENPDVDFEELANKLEEQIHMYLLGDWDSSEARRSRMSIQEEDAKRIYAMYRRGTLKIALGKYSGGKDSGDYGKGSRYDDPLVIEAVIDFFEQGKHWPYLTRKQSD